MSIASFVFAPHFQPASHTTFGPLTLIDFAMPRLFGSQTTVRSVLPDSASAHGVVCIIAPVIYDMRL